VPKDSVEKRRCISSTVRICLRSTRKGGIILTTRTRGCHCAVCQLKACRLKYTNALILYFCKAWLCILKEQIKGASKQGAQKNIRNSEGVSEGKTLEST
jgi:hypothetical protein